MAKKSKENFTQTNRSVDQFLASGYMAIEESYAKEQLSKYLADLELLDKGATIKEVYGDKKSQRLVEFNSEENVVNIDLQDPEQEIPKGSVAYLRFEGVMRMEDSISHQGVSSFTETLERLRANKNVIGVVVETNSGGGSGLAGMKVHNAVLDFRSTKPIVNYVYQCASACVHGFMGSTHIMMAGAEAQTGSIGVMSTIDKWLLEYYKKNTKELYSKKSGNKNFEWRELLKGNEKPLIKSMTRVDELFMQEVLTYRNLKGSQSTIDETLSGGMFNAQDAIDRGLADSIGTKQDAINLVRNLSLKNSKETKMTLSKRIVDVLNRVLGTTFQSGQKQAEVAEELEAMETLEEQVEEAVSVQMSDVMARIEKLEGGEDSEEESQEEQEEESQEEDSNEEQEEANEEEDATEENQQTALEKLESRMDKMEKENKRLALENKRLNKEKARRKNDDEFHQEGQGPDLESGQSGSGSGSFSVSVGFGKEKK